mmetsp:Transcript_81640/g.143970  ORF Transcript_81640/g.143970 Transcript_81640/m.143970 type:complete len:229 (-) Transcript_81640:91-777(-)
MRMRRKRQVLRLQPWPRGTFKSETQRPSPQIGMGTRGRKKRTAVMGIRIRTRIGLEFTVETKIGIGTGTKTGTGIRTKVGIRTRARIETGKTRTESGTEAGTRNGRRRKGGIEIMTEPKKKSARRRRRRTRRRTGRRRRRIGRRRKRRKIGRRIKKTRRRRTEIRKRTEIRSPSRRTGTGRNRARQSDPEMTAAPAVIESGQRTRTLGSVSPGTRGIELPERGPRGTS